MAAMPNGARVMVVVAAIAAAYFLAGVALLLFRGPWWLPVFAFVACATWAVHRLFRPHELRLERRGRGLCPDCGYNLRGNLSGVCPECGGNVP